MSHSTPTPRRGNRGLTVGLAAVVLCAGIGGTAFSTTGAWFTANSTASGNSVTAGSLSLGALGDTAGGLIQATNSYPMTDAQAVVAATAVPEAVIRVANTGSLPLSANVTLSNVTVTKALTNTAAGTVSNTVVRASLWNATTSTWSTPVLLTSLVGGSQAALSNIVVAPSEVKTVRIRIFLDSTAGDQYQQAKVTFDATATAMQTNKV